MADPNYNQNANYNAGVTVPVNNPVNNPSPQQGVSNNFADPNTPSTSNINNSAGNYTAWDTATGQLTHQGLQSYTPPSSISSAQLTSTPAPTFSSPASTPSYPVTSLPSSLVTSPTGVSTTGGLGTAESQAQSSTSYLAQLNNEMLGKATDTNNLFAQYGYGTTTDANGNIVANDPTLNDLNAKLTGLTNEAQAIPLQAQNAAMGLNRSQSDITMSSNEQLRTNAIAALSVSSLIAAKQGKLAYATQLVQNAVNQKYGPIQAKIDAATKNLDLIKNSPEYDIETKQRAAAAAAALAQTQANLDIAKTNYTNTQNEVLKYAGIADAQTLSAMQQAQTPAQVSQIAAQYGLQQPQTGRYKDVNATLKNLDGSTYQVTKVLDTVTGQYVHAPAGTTAAQLNAGGSGGTSNNGSTTTHSGPAGTTGAPTIDATAPNYSTALVGNTQLTQSAIDMKALSYITSGTLPPTGRTGIAGVQNAAISNRMGEMAAGGNLALNKADFKADSQSLAQQQKYLDTTTRAFNTANDTLASLQTFMQQNNINPSQFPDINSFNNYLKAKGIDPGAAGGYNAQIATLRAEYSQVLAKGGVRSVETDQEAAKLIPDGLAPAQLAKVASQIETDGRNVTADAQKQVTDIQDRINKQLHPASDTSTPSKLPQDVQDTLSKNLTIQGTTAYIPRSVWSSLPSSQYDAILAEAKQEGFNLLIK